MELCRLNKEKNCKIFQLNTDSLDRIYNLYIKYCGDRHKELELLKKFEKNENQIETLLGTKYKNNSFLDIKKECQEIINEYQPTISQIEKLIESQASVASELSVNLFFLNRNILKS
ncbi:hypothetical protein MXB_2166 [Myxobolus squamalis]|nr:hypothetical protein MXB_2166 [Myxobolus squamalis]